jgi:signal transduction histidine kinase
MTDNFRSPRGGRSVETRQVEALRETLDRLRDEVAELRASRERFVLSADADRRAVERELHDGVQQHLVALAANVQLAAGLVEADPTAAKELLEQMGRDVQQALDETGKLAHRIYPPLLDAGGLAAAVRSAAVSAGVRTRIGVTAGAAYPPEVAGAVYFCCLEVLQRAGAGASAAVMVRDGEGALAFEVVADCVASETDLLPLRDRVEALGGRLTIRSASGRVKRVSGSLPLSR